MQKLPNRVCRIRLGFVSIFLKLNGSILAACNNESININMAEIVLTVSHTLEVCLNFFFKYCALYNWV